MTGIGICNGDSTSLDHVVHSIRFTGTTVNVVKKSGTESVAFTSEPRELRVYVNKGRGATASNSGTASLEVDLINVWIDYT